MLLLAVYLFIAAVSAQNDDTIVPEAYGGAVVEQSLDIIRETCIFEYDNRFFRRMAYVETNDGQVSDTYPDDYHGGIWRIDEAMYEQTKTSTNPDTQALISAIANTASLHYIDWDSTTWEDLRMPLYSALGAILYTYDQVGDSEYEIPADVDAQADFWQEYIRPDGDIDYFILAAETLQEGCYSPKADIVFVLDASGSISIDNFELCKDFVKDMINSFDTFGEEGYQIGLQQYASESQVEWYLSTYSDKSSLLSAVDGIVKLGGGTDTWEALDDVIDVSFQASSGARENVARVVIVLTDGESGSETSTIESAEKIHAESITSFAISVGSSIRESELIAIATDPDCLFYFALDNFNDLNVIIDTIQDSTCEAPTILVPSNDSTIDIEDFPPGEGQNCQLTLPASGATVKLEAEGTTINYYTAYDTYPNEAYYEDKIVAYPGQVGTLYIEGGILPFIYCYLYNNGSFPGNGTIEVDEGDTDYCDGVECYNGGSCSNIIEAEGYVCNCHPDYTGEHCEDLVNPPTTTSTTTTTTAAPTTTLDPDWCDHCHDGPCDCSGNGAPNPCPACADGGCVVGNLHPYYANDITFCQCDDFGGCFELDCPEGTVYKECLNACAFDYQECP